jgi:hypothetical protein
MTPNVRACMLRAFEASQSIFRASTLHEQTQQAGGPGHYPTLVREAISLLVRFETSVPTEYIGKSCFYDITREIKSYRDLSTRCRILSDRGVTSDQPNFEVSIALEPILIKLSIPGEIDAKKYVIARTTGQNPRKRPAREADDW